MREKRRGFFVVLEGPDKSGKSTQAGLLVSALKKSGCSILHTREPGGTTFAEAVRSVLLDPRHQVHPLAELLLYEAARAQHTQEILLPALNRGEIVVCERYTLATTAYQGHARGLPLSLVHQLNRIATGGLRPDLCLVLDIPEERFQTRDKTRVPDRLEKESIAFRHKVRRAYRALARSEPKTALINGDRNQDLVHQDILARVASILDARSRIF